MTVRGRLSSIKDHLIPSTFRSRSKTPLSTDSKISTPAPSAQLPNHPSMAGMDPGLNSLLQWSVENSDQTRDPNKPVTQPKAMSADALRTLMGGPSDADLMKQSMAVIISSETSAENKMVAFDNFEQLVENLDNANNIAPLGLWTPLLSQLDSSEADMRRMAAWCIGTAVQNNEKSQERCLAMGGVQKLCDMAVNDADRAVRRKAVYGLSSMVRNYQPAMNEMVKTLPKEFVGPDQLSATDMDVIDAVMSKLRDRD